MKIWLLFAIASIFASWLHNFTLKIAAEKKYNISVINILSNFISLLIFWLILVFQAKNIYYSNIWIIIFLALLNWLFFFFSMFSRIESLKNIDTVLFFPLYKTFWPIFVTLMSIFFFKETLETKELIWIIIWILIPLLLINNTEKIRQKNLFYWIFLVILTAIFVTISTWASKEIMIKKYDMYLYLFISSFIATIFWVISYYIFTYKKNWFNLGKKELKFSIISWIFYFLSFYLFMVALNWNMAIVYTINSFSILIPIILSIIFYKEHFDFKKWFVIFLSIVSMMFFI